MKTRHASNSGFSLVEVTLALGVVVFCLVTILGLLAVGINTTHVSTTQTAATNILTAVAADVEATPNITPSYTAGLPTPGAKAKGTVAETSLIYGIKLPIGGAGATSTTTPSSPIYIGENGQLVASASLALYQLNYWITASSTTKQETFVRLLITWPANVTYSSAPNFVENVIAVNRT